MQKISKKASILLWTIFLSVIISVSFIGVSTKINKKLHNNSLSIEGKDIDKIISNKISTGDFTSQNFSNGESIYFEEPNYFNTSLNNKQNINIGFSGAIDISINKGGPIFYSIKDDSSGLITGSGVIDKSDILNGAASSLLIKNLGGLTNISLRSENNLKLQKQKYKIIQTIGNKKILKTSGTIIK